MNEHDHPVAAAFPIKRRVPIAAPQDLIHIETPADGATLPVKICPARPNVAPSGWAGLARDEIQSILLQSGAILFRGFDINSESEFQRFIESVSGNPLPYLERSSPRTQVKGHIYTSTDYPPERSIFLHCENSYQKAWPMKIFFYCDVPPGQGGETPIADTRRILARLDPEVRGAFARNGVLYVRNFGAGLGLPWQAVFQTEDRELVERYCSENGMECVWHGSDNLMTRCVRPAIRKHPVTGDEVWFNHAVFFHISTLDLSIQKMLREVVRDEELPNTTYYGDGAAIEPETLEHIKAAFAEETVSFPWLKGDVLMLDNMLVAHGRSPYRQPRKILVGMTELYEDCANKNPLQSTH